jgi:hypothetical protein
MVSEVSFISNYLIYDSEERAGAMHLPTILIVKVLTGELRRKPISLSALGILALSGLISGFVRISWYVLCLLC